MLHLGSIGGTSLRVDANFLILCLFFVVFNYDESLGIQYALIWIPILFISVLVHELAHAASFAVFGYGASDVVLTGMGGVTINRNRTKAWHDVIISLAGPVSSFALMYLCMWIYTSVPAARTDRMLDALLPRMIAACSFWGFFNLIPVAPLDGGHAVRSFFSIFLRDRTAFVIYVWIAMIVGGATAVLFAVSRSYILAIYIAWFVFTAFQQWQYFRRYGTPGD